MYHGPGESIGAVVVDLGSTSTRVGFAGDDYPKAYFPSAVGISVGGDEAPSSPSNAGSWGGGDAGHHHVDAASTRGDLSLTWPVRAGEVVDWGMAEELLDHALSKYLKCTLENHPIMLSEKSAASRGYRHKFTEILFEKHGVPAMFISKDATLSCFAVGRTTGLCVDVSSITTVTPVLDGWAERRGCETSIIGGDALHTYMALLMARKGMDLTPRALPLRPGNATLLPPDKWHESLRTHFEKEIARDLLEHTCRVTDTRVDETAPQFAAVPGVPYHLPDGTEVSVGINRFLAPEIYFEPRLSAGIDGGFLNDLEERYPDSSRQTLPQAILNSFVRCERDQHLSNNIVLAGGGSYMENLPERLKVEVEETLNREGAFPKVRVIAPNSQERRVATWLGGSILASLGSFHEMWMSKAEYDEHGASFMDRKCP